MCTARILMDPMKILQITIMMGHRCCLQYCADSVLSMIQRSSAAETLDSMLLELGVFSLGVVQPEVFSALDRWPDAPHQWSNARTPLYLRDLSIRC